jgi:hypothetical protein
MTYDFSHNILVCIIEWGILSATEFFIIVPIVPHINKARLRAISIKPQKFKRNHNAKEIVKKTSLRENEDREHAI